MKNLIMLILLFSIGCNSNAQKNGGDKNKSNVIVENGILKSVHGVAISKYEIQTDIIDVDMESITLEHLLCLAADECDEELLKELIQRGADLNSKICDDDDVITLLAACMENGVALTKLMLENGANINGADQDNGSFLTYAIVFDNLNLVEYLADNGADRLQRDINENMGCLPVHRVKSVEMLKLLMAKGFEINQSCDNGRNILHFAAKYDLREVAQYLLENRLVDMNQKDKNGETPLDYATKSNHLEIAEIIKSKR